jgi:cytoskeletal protein RodZ
MPINEVNSHTNFGRYLKVIRNRRGISLETVSQKTNISVDFLAAIESENHDRLPAHVFVKGFIRDYADIVGASGDSAVAIYEKNLQGMATADKAGRKKRSTLGFWGRLCGALLLFFGVILVSIVIDSVGILGSRPDKNAFQSQEHNQQSSDKASTTSAADTSPQTTTSKVLILEADATDAVTLKIIADGEKPKTYALDPGGHLKVEAFRDFNILVNNPKGVNLYFNGKPVEIPNRSRREVNIRIP